jgi:hypothetical protein
MCCAQSACTQYYGTCLQQLPLLNSTSPYHGRLMHAAPVA